jgi:hypothetical protein
MSVPYKRPGITVKEVQNPVVQALLGEQTSICIVGPAQGYQEYVETHILEDNEYVTLGATFPDLDTLEVVDASNLTTDPFTPSSAVDNEDYDIDDSELTTTGVVRLRRSMQTTIPDGESVVVYYEDSDEAFTENLTLDGVETAAPNNRSADVDDSTLIVQSPGLIPDEDYTIAAEGTDACTIAGVASPTVVGADQTILYDYTIAVQQTWTITFTGGPTAGNTAITFTYDGDSHESADVAYNVSAADMKTAIENAIAAHDDFTTGNVRVTRSGAGTAGDPYVYTAILQGELAADDGATLASSAPTGAVFSGGTSPTTTVTKTQAGAEGAVVKNQEVQLDGTTPVSLPSDSINHVIKNQSSVSTPTSTAIVYDEGTTTDLDYIVTGTGASLLIARSQGTTTMNPTTNKITVRITYQATPVEYWYPTRVFSQIDAEEKFGPAMNSSGEITSPISFASMLAFANGATNVVCQALFAESGGIRSAPTGIATDWESTLANLRGVEGINLMVPLVSSGGLTSSDAIISAIMAKVQSFINYMREQQQRWIDVAGGSDSTQYGQGSKAAIRALSETLRGSRTSPNIEAQQFSIMNLGSYKMANPVNGSEMTIGGQYAAAAYAGMAARNPIQEPTTRKVFNLIKGAAETRTEDEKFEDADAGLTVTEDVRGLLQVRHGITTSNASVAAREFNVVRAKHYLIKSMRETLNQLIGTLVADDESPFTVALAATALLEELKTDRIIVGYDGVQARQVAGDPTHVELRFRYLPAFPLNYITVRFSLDTNSGAVTSELIGV